MDDKKLKKLFSNKKFLKKNEFVELTKQAVLFAKQNKKTVVLAAVLLVILGLSAPFYQWHQIKKTQAFNLAFYNADKGLEKEASFEAVLKSYNNIPGAQLARLKLIDTLLSHNKTDKAVQVIEEGLKKNGENIFSTILILKQIDLLKKANKYEEAALFAKENSHKAIKPFLAQLQLLQGDLFLLADKKEEAKKVFETLVSSSDNTNETSAQAAQTAKDKLLLIDMGVL